MDDRELYWGLPHSARSRHDSPAFYTRDTRGARTWSASFEPDFRGRGPKNYRRPDIRILEDINEDLTLSPYVDATEISVEVHQGVVTLGGHVHERRAKHIAEEEQTKQLQEYWLTAPRGMMMQQHWPW